MEIIDWKSNGLVLGNIKDRKPNRKIWFTWRHISVRTFKYFYSIITTKKNNSSKIKSWFFGSIKKRHPSNASSMLLANSERNIFVFRWHSKKSWNWRWKWKLSINLKTSMYYQSNFYEEKSKIVFKKGFSYWRLLHWKYTHYSTCK